jgi:ABC-type transport system involved in multi-copper enzyme maturation permease subunit
MKRLLKLEFKKAFCSRWFIAALLIGIVLAVICACITAVSFYGEGGPAEYVKECIANDVVPLSGLDSSTLYNNWMGGVYDTSTVVFFYLVPLIAVLPCGWNCSEEINEGYMKVIVPRVGRRKYFSAKLIASFTSGGAAVALPLLFSLVITAAIIPTIAIEPYNEMYYGVSHGDMLSSMAYSHPLLYALVYIGIDFLIAGCFACLPVVVSLYSEKRVAALIVPYIAVILCDAARNLLSYISYIEISPLGIMRVAQHMGAVKPYILIAWLAIYAAVALVFGLRKGEKREIV